MVMMLADIFDILASPTDTFNELKDRPRWFFAFVIISVISIGVAWFLAPLSEHVTYEMLAARLGEEEAQKAVAFADRLKYLSVLFVPLGLLLRWLVVSAFLYFSSVILEAPPNLKFKNVYVVVVYSEVILVLAGIVNLLLLYLKGVDSIHTATDLQAVVGLDILLRSKTANIPVYILLNAVNVFNLWYLVVLSIGMSIVTNFGKLKSFGLVTFTWSLGVGYQALLGGLLKAVPFP